MNRYCEVCCRNTVHNLQVKPIDRIENLASIWNLDEELKELFNLREGYSCSVCYSSMRTQGIASLLVKVTNSKNFEEFLNENRGLSIAEINSCANLHDRLSCLENLKYSEYFDQEEQLSDVLKSKGIQHQDITSLSYDDNCFDVVLHSETVEHIADPAKAIKECLRVLKPGGICVFTTPIVWGRKTKQKFSLTNGKAKLHNPVSYHGDLNSRYPVMFEFGNDIEKVLNVKIKNYIYDAKCQSYVFLIAKEVKTASLTEFNLSAVKDINISELKKAEDNAKKGAIKMLNKVYHAELINDGERMIPEFHENNLFFAEHMTRYSQTLPLVKDKTILDIACGSGYGTKILSSSAKKVYGVDVSRDAIEYAKQRYGGKNIDYLVGSGERIPLQDGSVDVVVTYETIEHIENYKKFLKELKRVLKKDGIAVISTPNDLEYAEGNHHHIHQFKYNELFSLLKKDFKYIDSYFQSTWRAVLLDKIDGHTSSSERPINLKLFNPISSPDQTLYFYLVCSNKPIKTTPKPIFAAGPHLSEANEWYDKRDLLKEIDVLKQKTEELATSLGKIERSRAHKLAKNISNIKSKVESILK